jgi:hypothetical protein
MEKDNDDKQGVLVQWLNDTFIDEDDEEAKQKAIKLINKKPWPVLLSYTEAQWKELVKSVEIGIDIYNHLHTGITIIQNIFIKSN